MKDPMHKTSKTEFKSTMIPIEELISQHLQTLDCFVLSTMSTLDIMEQGSKYPMSASQTNSPTLTRDQLPSYTTPHGTQKLSKILCYTFFFLSNHSILYIYVYLIYILNFSNVLVLIPTNLRSFYFSILHLHCCIHLGVVLCQFWNWSKIPSWFSSILRITTITRPKKKRKQRKFPCRKPFLLAPTLFFLSHLATINTPDI